jgi:ABC-type Fe3+ transport system substrate-binding protein
VYSPRLAQAPDLATAEAKYGLAHPLLSNNGIYNVLFFETLDPAAGKHALERTSIQPVNARATIGGIVDGSFDLTLGYEAVTLLYQSKGAQVKTDLPNLHGNRTVLPVLLSAAVVKHHHHPDAERFVRFLFTNETQSGLAKSFFRPVAPDQPDPQGEINAAGVPPLAFDWSRWAELEAKLPDYEVKP